MNGKKLIKTIIFHDQNLSRPDYLTRLFNYQTCALPNALKMAHQLVTCLSEPPCSEPGLNQPLKLFMTDLRVGGT